MARSLCLVIFPRLPVPDQRLRRGPQLEYPIGHVNLHVPRKSSRYVPYLVVTQKRLTLFATADADNRISQVGLRRGPANRRRPVPAALSFVVHENYPDVSGHGSTLQPLQQLPELGI